MFHYKAFLSLKLIHQRAQTFIFVTYKKKIINIYGYPLRLIPDGITLCIQTDIMKYEISSQCKANEKLVSEESNSYVGGFFLWILLKESLNYLFVFMVPDLYLTSLRLLMIKTAGKRLIA
jgi:hypothetical protein